MAGDSQEPPLSIFGLQQTLVPRISPTFTMRFNLTCLKSLPKSMILCRKSSGCFANISTRTPLTPGKTQLQFPFCCPSPTHCSLGEWTQPGPIHEGSLHPSICLLPHLPNTQDWMSHMSLLCFARTRWKETTARPTVSLTPLIISQYRLCHRDTQTQKDMSITQRKAVWQLLDVSLIQKLNLNKYIYLLFWDTGTSYSRAGHCNNTALQVYFSL